MRSYQAITLASIVQVSHTFMWTLRTMLRF